MYILYTYVKYYIYMSYISWIVFDLAALKKQNIC